MKIKRIILDDTNFFIKKEINLCDENGMPYKNIIFAGENGTGKTKIFDSLFKSLSFTTKAIPGQFGKLIVEKTLNDCSVEYVLSQNEISSFNKIWSAVNQIHDKNKYFDENGKLLIEGNIFAKLTERLLYIHGTNILSKVKRDNKTIVQANLEIGKELVQLVSRGLQEKTQKFNDINTYDDQTKEEIKKIVGLGTKYIQKFSDAYESMMNIKINVSGGAPIFRKNGEKINIEDFSSGEHEIIHRSFELLKTDWNNDSIVMIDEPEVHLHPKLQQKIFPFYKKLLSTQDIQNNQLFIATHSENIIKSAIHDKDTLIISFAWDKKENKVTLNKFPYSNILPYETYSELKYSVFNLVTTDFHNELYGYINEYVLAHPDWAISGSLIDVDNFINTEAKCEKKYEWVQKATKKYKVTLPTYIRNYIHHPEMQKLNDVVPVNEFDAKLEESTKILIELINKFKEGEKNN